MTQRPKSKYKRCKVCRELVVDPDNCANCEHQDPWQTHPYPGNGKRGSPTLDIQEGNSEENF